MNSDIIPQGPTETVTDGTISKQALLVTAETDIVVSNLVWLFPAAPANPGAVNTFTLKARGTLYNVKSFSFTGTATIIYRHNA